MAATANLSFLQTRSDSVTPLSTSHAHLMRHERSSSLGGPYPSHPLQTHTFSVPPPHPPKKISNPKKHRAPPAPSFSTSALLPPLFITPPPLSLPTSSHSLEGTPTGPEGLSLGENRPVRQHVLTKKCVCYCLERKQLTDVWLSPHMATLGQSNVGKGNQRHNPPSV